MKLQYGFFEKLGIGAVLVGLLGCMSLANKSLVDMDQSYQVVPSSTSSMVGETVNAVRRGRMVAITGWSPHWMNARLPLKYLKDPKGVFGDSEGIYTVTRQGFSEEYPQVAQFLRQFRWKAADLDGLSLCSYQQDGDYTVGARIWMKKNPWLLNRWLKGVSPQPGAVIRLVNSGHYNELAVNALMKLILEEKMDCRVICASSPAPRALASLAEGANDMMVTVWMISSNRRVLDGIRSRVELVGCNLPDAVFGIAVPEYAPVDSIADLKKYYSEFGGRILGIESGTGVNQLAWQAIEAYGLNDPIMMRQ